MKKPKKISLIVSTGFIVLLLIVVVYSLGNMTVNQPERAYQKNCALCHLLPDPAELPKKIWKEGVLPEMAMRMGVKIGDSNPMKGLSMEEQYFTQLHGVYPEKPMISKEEWDKIVEYILSKAPETLQLDNRKNRGKPLDLFHAQLISLDNRYGGAITSLQFDKKQQNLFVGTLHGELYKWEKGKKAALEQLLTTPVVSYIGRKGNHYLTEIGIINPSEVPEGKIWEINKPNKKLLVDKLHRPVYIEVMDMNNDGEEEIIICEFGHGVGQLSYLKKNQKGNYDKYEWIKIPGLLKIIPADLNKDKRTDLILLASQGNEGVVILYNQGNFKFSIDKPIQLKPGYGVSWFDVMDYNGDGHLDFALVNGDNADYSYTLKPYHGLRIYLNQGNNQFKEACFYPIHGATRVIARDFDKDNDIDFAISAFFPDYKNVPKESFVYLENTDSKNYTFQPRTFDEAVNGKWMLMESGDFDNDGDEDIMLGSNTNLVRAGEATGVWLKENTDMILLENKLNKPN